MVFNLNHKALIISKVLLPLDYRLKVLMGQTFSQMVGLWVNKKMRFLLLISNFFNHLILAWYLRQWNKSEVKKETLIKVMALQIVYHFPHENYFKAKLNQLTLKNKFMIMKKVLLFWQMILINLIRISTKSLKIKFL